MRADIRPNRRKPARPAWKVERAYRQWIKGRRCAFEKLGGCWGPIEFAHTPDPLSKGMGTQAADRNAIPACQAHHHEQTVKGWSAVGLTRESAQALAADYWRLWPGDKGDLA